MRRLNSQISSNNDNDKGIFSKTTMFNSLRGGDASEGGGFSLFMNGEKSKSIDRNNSGFRSEFMNSIAVKRMNSRDANNDAENGSGVVDMFPFQVNNENYPFDNVPGFVGLIDSMEFNQNNRQNSILNDSGRFGGLSGSYQFGNLLERSLPEINCNFDENDVVVEPKKEKTNIIT